MKGSQGDHGPQGLGGPVLNLGYRVACAAIDTVSGDYLANVTKLGVNTMGGNEPNNMSGIGIWDVIFEIGHFAQVPVVTANFCRQTNKGPQGNIHIVCTNTTHATFHLYDHEDNPTDHDFQFIAIGIGIGNGI